MFILAKNLPKHNPVIFDWYIRVGKYRAHIMWLLHLTLIDLQDNLEEIA